MAVAVGPRHVVGTHGGRQATRGVAARDARAAVTVLGAAQALAAVVPVADFALQRSLLLEAVTQRIVVLREQKVLIDADLAALYGVETRQLNEQVRRNQCVADDNSNGWSWCLAN